MRFMKSIVAGLAALALTLAGVAPALAVGVGPTGLNIGSSMLGTIVQTDTFGSTHENLNLQTLEQMTGGTGAGQIDTFYRVALTISASSSTTIDLNGSATDQFGNTVSFLHVKGILVTAASGNTNDCQIGPGASNPFAGPWSGTTPLTAISPGEMMLVTKGAGSAAGWAVVASTGDIIKVANSSSGSSVTCSVLIWGTST